MMNFTWRRRIGALAGVCFAFVISHGAARLMGQEEGKGAKARLIQRPKYVHAIDDTCGGLPGIDPECVLNLVRAYRSDSDARIATWVVMAELGPEAVPPLATALKSADSQVREDAALGLGLLATHAYASGFHLTNDSDTNIVPALIEALKDENANVRMHVLGAIRAIGPDALEALPALLEMLKNENCRLDERVISAIGGLGARARPAVERLRKHDSEIVRGRADTAIRKIRVFELIEQFKEEDNRREKILALAEMGPDAVGPILHVFEREWVPFEGAGPPEPSLSGPVSLALERIGKAAVPPLLAVLQDDNAVLRCIAAGELGSLGGFAGAAESALGEGADVDEYVAEIYRGIELEDVLELKASLVDQAVPALMTALKDVDEEFRSSAVGALGSIGPPAREALPDLLEMLTAEGVADRHGIAFTLERIGVEAVPGLKEAVRHEDPGVSSWAAHALGRIGQHANEASPALIQALDDDDEYVSVGAADALVRVGGDSKLAMPVPIAASNDGDLLVRHYSMRTLGRMGSEAKEAVPVLITLLESANGSDRMSAAEALGGIGPDAAGAVPALIAALKDQNSSLRKRAATALGKIGPKAKDAVPALIAALKDDTSWVRRAAAETLGGIGPEAKSAVPALTEALGDENERVRKAVGEALQKIDPSRAP